MKSESRIAHSVRNISVGLVAQVITMIAGFASRTIFIKYLAVEYLGVNSLFTNILSMLSLAELGIGAAFMYALYKPVAYAEESTIAAILRFYRKVYMLVGMFIFLSGLLLIPFLDSIIPQKPAAITEDIRLIYLFFLANTAITYFFSYKISVLQAAQRMSTATVNSTIFTLIQHVSQIAVLVITADFILYLSIQLITTVLSNLSLSRIVDKQHPYLKKYRKTPVSPELRSSIVSNIKSTFLTKIGGVLVNGTDNLIINYFVGLALLGKYSNYVLLLTIATNFLVIIFNNTNASIANVVVKENIEKQREVFNVINFANFWIYGFCAVCFVVLCNDFITLWIGAEYVISRDIVAVMALNFFMVGMQNAFWAFKSSMGIFRQGRYVVLLTALLNLVLSFWFGSLWGIFGVLLATAVARLLTNFWFDPYLVFTLGLRVDPVAYFLKFLKYFTIPVISILAIDLIVSKAQFDFVSGLILKILLCILITNGIILGLFGKKQEIVLFKSILQKTFRNR